MANQTAGPTRYGQDVPFYAFGASQDIYPNRLATLSPIQEGMQLGSLFPTMAKLQGGWGAPNIAPIAREEQRRFRQEVIPDLMEQFAAGGGQGALLRGIQGAGSDLMTRLGSLQQQQQFELQKQRQEQLPRLLEMGLKPTFQTALTDMPIRPESTVDKKTGERKYAQVSNLPLEEKFWRTAKGKQLAEEIEAAGGDIADVTRGGVNIARQIPRAGKVVAEDINAARKAIQNYGYRGAIAAARKVGGPKGAAQMRAIADQISRIAGAPGKYAQNVAKRSTPPTLRQQKESIKQEKETGKVSRGLDRILERNKATIRPALRNAMNREHLSYVNSIMKHKRPIWKEAFGQVRTLPKLKELGKLAREKNVRTEKIQEFINKLGKGK